MPLGHVSENYNKVEAVWATLLLLCLKQGEAFYREI